MEKVLRFKGQALMKMDNRRRLFTRKGAQGAAVINHLIPGVRAKGLPPRRQDWR